MERRGGVDTEGASSGSLNSAAPRRKWALTSEAFDSLLAALGEDRESAARQYLALHSNLVQFFQWRGCSFPNDHADETLNRVAKRVAAGEEVHSLSAYALGVARMLLLEIIKERAREEIALKETASTQESAADTTDSEEQLDCLKVCLQNLPADSRELIIQYYQGERGEKIRNRKRLLQLLGIPVNTLRMRALRLRDKLKDCVEKCLKR